jgi:hypothetical protein
LSETGEELARIFGRDMSRNIPKTFGGCKNIPCLSEIGRVESRRLRDAFLGSGNPDAERRLATFKEIGKPLLRKVLGTGSVRPVLETYLDSRKGRESDTAKMLHRAAVLELEAFPLTSLFHFLYENGDLQKIRLPNPASLRSPYILRNPKSDLDGFLQDMVNHLSKAERLGRSLRRKNLMVLKEFIMQKHLFAKVDSPWVDEHWVQLRTGLAPKTGASIHGFRMAQFASLLRDLDEI